MTTFEIAALALALAIDAFAVAASVSPKTPPLWGPLRLATSFGLFQSGMLLVGALFGAYLLVYVSAYDHWVAFGLLQIVGLRMVVEAFRNEEDGDEAPAGMDPSRGMALMTLSLATSIDSFGAGLGLRVAGANLWVASPVVGAVTAALTAVGGGLGRTARRRIGRRAEVLGGLVLMGLGLKMLQV